MSGKGPKAQAAVVPESGKLGKAIAKSLLETFFEFSAAMGVILAALGGDLDGTHQTGQATCGGPVHFVGQTKQHSCPKGIAATGGVGHGFGRHAGNVDAAALGKYFRPLFAARDN